MGNVVVRVALGIRDGAAEALDITGFDEPLFEQLLDPRSGVLLHLKVRSVVFGAGLERRLG